MRELISGRSLAPNQFLARMGYKAAVLWQQGVRQGDRVILLHGNSLEFFCDLFAIWYLGATAVPLHPSTTPTELQVIVDLSHAKLILTRKKTEASIPVRHTEDDFTSSKVGQVACQWPSGPQECLILFSSGSTSRPKGIRHGWSGLLSRIVAIQKNLGRVNETLNFLPTSFGHGLIANCLAPWLSDSHLSLLPEFNPLLAGDFSTLIRGEEIEFFSSVPVVWKLLQRVSSLVPMPGLRRVHCASAPLDRDTREFMRRWSDRSHTCNVYGMTELASWTAGTPIRYDQQVEDGFIGKPWAARFAILRQNELVTKANVLGELCVQSESLMLSYLEDKPDLSIDGFFRTGDLGKLDDQGNIFLCGRLGSEINKGGFKISSSEIKSCLESHPQVIQAWVGGFKDDIWGETVAVAVAVTTNTPLADLKKWCQDRLSSIKQPSHWLLRDELPISGNGKVDGSRTRFLLEESISGQTS